MESPHLKRASVADRAVHFPVQNSAIDHIVPRSKGGDDEIENLQLLCNVCNSKRGTKCHAEPIAILRAEGTLN